MRDPAEQPGAVLALESVLPREDVVGERVQREHACERRHVGALRTVGCVAVREQLGPLPQAGARVVPRVGGLLVRLGERARGARCEIQDDAEGEPEGEVLGQIDIARVFPTPLQIARPTGKRPQLALQHADGVGVSHVQSVQAGGQGG
nr:hypothetical protein [Microbacterium trichothecenolyticum]